MVYVINLSMDVMTAMCLEFHPKLNAIGKGKKLRDGLSAVVQIGGSLWVANDHTVSLERLSLVKRGM